MSVWVTAEGERIPFSELTDDHLVNIVHFLEKKAPEMHKKALNRYKDAYAEAKAETEDYVLSWAAPSKAKRKLEHLKNRVRTLESKDPRDPYPYPGASPYYKLLTLAKQRNLLPKDYDWTTPIEEQKRDMEKMAALTFRYGHENPFSEIFGGRRQGKTSALEQAILEARVKMAELQANPPLVFDIESDPVLRFVPHQGLKEGDAVMIGGFSGPCYIAGIDATGITICGARTKLAPRSTTRKLRK